MEVIMGTTIIKLTKEEQKTIHDLYWLFDNDPTLDNDDTWDILQGIALNNACLTTLHGYAVEISE